MTRIRITIDELVLDGATHLDQAQLVQALQQALAQQAAAQGLPAVISVPQVQQDVNGFSAENVARQITQAIYGDQT